MTTSSDNLPTTTPEEPPDELPWEDDTFGETWVEKESGPNGVESVYYYHIQDRSYEDGWLKSTESRDLKKMT